MIKQILLVIVCYLPIAVFAAGGSAYPLMHMSINMHDKASLQRGARLYMNYCQGCHSLKYMRYNRMAKGIGIVDRDGKIDSDLVKANLIFTGAKIFDTIHTAMAPQQAKAWFGVVPPDLSLIARVRGVDWLYTYLLSFYKDTKRPFGTNNALFPDVAMPNVLLSLQGEQRPVYKKVAVDVHETANAKELDVDVKGKMQEVKEITHLEMMSHGQMSSIQFHQSVKDLVNFLAYVGEPMQMQRKSIGTWVLIFLAVFIVLSYLLKRAFWKDIH